MHPMCAFLCFLLSGCRVPCVFCCIAEVYLVAVVSWWSVVSFDGKFCTSKWGKGFAAPIWPLRFLWFSSLFFFPLFGLYYHFFPLLCFSLHAARCCLVVAYSCFPPLSPVGPFFPYQICWLFLPPKWFEGCCLGGIFFAYPFSPLSNFLYCLVVFFFSPDDECLFLWLSDANVFFIFSRDLLMVCLCMLFVCAFFLAYSEIVRWVLLINYHTCGTLGKCLSLYLGVYQLP